MRASFLWHWRARMWGPPWFRRAMQAYDWWRSGEPMCRQSDVEYILKRAAETQEAGQK